MVWRKSRKSTVTVVVTSFPPCQNRCILYLEHESATGPDALEGHFVPLPS